MKKLYAAVAALLFMPFSFIASDGQGPWMNVNESSVKLTGKRQIVPLKYLVYNADPAQLKSELGKAPFEKTTRMALSSCVISLPLPNGTYQRFRVVNSPVMDGELAAAFPDINTYSVKGIDDPYATGKLDWNEFGFHAMVLSPDGDFFIDPYCLGNTSDYISYYTTDFIKQATDIIPETGLIRDPQDQRKPSPQPAGTGAKASSAVGNCAGTNLRTYRLAIACTGEYAVAATGQSAPTVAQTLAKIVTSINRVDGVYEKEVDIRLVLINTETLVVFTNASTDPFTGNNNANTLITQSHSVITNTIGTANFDIGHTFSTGGGGLANLGCVCSSSNKGKGITGSPNPVGDPYDIDYVAHEMGHQFGADHTFNAGTGSCSGNRNGSTSVEPGSGITIMAYAGICGANDNLGNNSIPYFHTISFDQIISYTNSGGGNGCAVVSATGNQPPVVTAASSFVVPVYTPFYLTGSATDPDGDPLTYSWEETDPGASTGSWPTSARPYFRSYTPTTTAVRYFPKASVVASGNYTNTIGEYLTTSPQALNFRLTARDNKAGGGGVCYTNISVTIDNSGPLKVSYPDQTGIAWISGSGQTVTWDVNNTNIAPVSCDSVRIWISYNSGSTYSLLVNSTANDGSHAITAPQVAATINTCRIKVESKTTGNVFYDMSDNNFTISNDPNVGLHEVSQNNVLGLSVWPNPAGADINFSLANLNGNDNTSVEVMDVLGKVVYQSTFPGRSSVNGKIEAGALAPGIYFVKASNNNNQSVYRIVKQ